MSDGSARGRSGNRNRNNYREDERKEKAKITSYKFNPFKPAYQQ